MKLKTVIMAIGLVIVLMIVLTIAGMGFLLFDGMSYTATSSQTLSPAGTSLGNALVVYDPGVSGAAKTAATDIAGDLRSKGYTVDLAGVRSAAASNVSRYDVIVIGGPTYIGNISSSIKSYLQDLKPSPNAIVGVFATGTEKPTSDDPAYMRRFVTSLPDDSSLTIKTAMKLVSGDDVSKRCEDFTSELV